MLYFVNIFSDGGDIFNLFRYITFRAGGAFFTALCFGFIFGKPLINFLKKKQESQENKVPTISIQERLKNKINNTIMDDLFLLEDE